MTLAQYLRSRSPILIVLGVVLLALIDMLIESAAPLTAKELATLMATQHFNTNQFVTRKGVICEADSDAMDNHHRFLGQLFGVGWHYVSISSGARCLVEDTSDNADFGRRPKTYYTFKVGDPVIARMNERGEWIVTPAPK